MHALVLILLRSRRDPLFAFRQQASHDVQRPLPLLWEGGTPARHFLTTHKALPSTFLISRWAAGSLLGLSNKKVLSDVFLFLPSASYRRAGIPSL